MEKKTVLNTGASSGIGKGVAVSVLVLDIRDSGHVINIGSIAGDAAYAGGNVYCVPNVVY